MLASRCWRWPIRPAPKSTNGRRTLPLDVEAAAALRALWARQASEKLAGWFSDEFGRLLARTDLAPGVLPRPVTPRCHR